MVKSAKKKIGPAPKKNSKPKRTTTQKTTGASGLTIRQVSPAVSNKVASILESKLVKESALSTSAVNSVLDVIKGVLPEIANAAGAGLALGDMGALNVHQCSGGILCDANGSDECGTQACDTQICTDGHSCTNNTCGTQACDDGQTCSNHAGFLDGGIYSTQAWETMVERFDALVKNQTITQPITLQIDPAKLRM